MNDMMTPKDVHVEKKMTRRFQCHLRQTRQLAFSKIGHRTILYRREDIEAFLTKRRIEALRTGGGAHE
ncbi:MAG: hypothetical protein NTV49_05245 [Kiritimatiellaeota bacterium]|nr:hypothetical protein [Kiritimatiellota bacterium]